MKAFNLILEGAAIMLLVITIAIFNFLLGV
jgi:hypothetical protein